MKADPSGMELRRPPAPVTRFNRRTISVLCGLLALAVVAALGYGLGARRAALAPVELNIPSGPPSERLNALPRTYAEVPRPAPPQLGPPLPGDLGRPILEAQRTMLDDDERQARLARAREAEAARTAKVHFRLVGAAGAKPPEAADGGRGGEGRWMLVRIVSSRLPSRPWCRPGPGSRQRSLPL